MFQSWTFRCINIIQRGGVGGGGGGFRIIQIYFFLVSQFMSDGSELDYTLDYQPRGCKIDSPLLRSFG